MLHPASNTLREIIEEFHLEVGGVKAWTPYWRDEVPKTADDRPVRGPLNGKGTPAQINDYLATHMPIDHTLDTEAQIQAHMFSLGLGVDCSGFIFYVLDQFLQRTRHTTLAEHLYKPREALIADFHNPAYTHPEHITLELLQNQPEQVPLLKIQQFWGNQPIRLAGVSILGSEAANVVIPRARDAKPGDQIFMAGITGVPHNVVIVSNDGDTITYAESGRTEEERLSSDRFGGVRYGRIIVHEPNRPMNYQTWESQEFFDEHIFDDTCHRRLRVLA